MKKIFLLGAFALFGVMNAQTGGFKLGAHVGIPVGDASDLSSVNFGADLAYTWRIAENFDLGVTTGYTYFSGKDHTVSYLGVTTTIEGEGTGFIPVAATGQYNLNGGFFIGADLGYAISTATGGKGGFLYQPKLGYTFAGKSDLYLSYKGISRDGATLASVNVGYAYKF